MSFLTASKRFCLIFFIDSGIVSAIGFSPSNNGMLALGSFSKKTAVYVEDNMELLFVLHGQEGGVTQAYLS